LRTWKVWKCNHLVRIHKIVHVNSEIDKKKKGGISVSPIHNMSSILTEFEQQR
jgi:hypothetical protein